MMKVRMLTLSASPEGNRLAGQIYSVPDEEGAELVKGGYAVELNAPAAKAEAAGETETATASDEDTETAAASSKGPGKRRK